MNPEIEALDHLVLTVKDIEATVTFYTKVLGMRKQQFGENRVALLFGTGDRVSKINLHPAGHEFEPKALLPTPGSADLCFLVSTPVEKLVKELGELVELGPVERTGARGRLNSIYLRDPDGNLVELANRL